MTRRLHQFRRILVLTVPTFQVLIAVLLLLDYRHVIKMGLNRLVDMLRYIR